MDKEKVEYHIRCADCGRFLKKELWVDKNHKWKEYAICSDCFYLYDSPEY